MQIELVVFDLAGVLVDFGGIESVARLSNGCVGPAEFDRFWSGSPWADALYTGRCTPEAFATGAVEEFHLAVSPQEFLREFQGWLRGPYPGALELVDQLRGHTRVACLSNTNALDVRRFREEFDLAAHLDGCFFSNEIGYRKPDPESYVRVLEAFSLASRADRALFLDDSASCVEGARRMGMQAHQVGSLAEIRSCLAALHIPPFDGDPVRQARRSGA